MAAPTHITIHGHEYAIELQENSALIAKLGASGADQRGHHFHGRLTQQANSWVRLSEVDGQFSGIVSLADEKYLIEELSADIAGALGMHGKQQNKTRVLAAKPAVELATEDAQCAVEMVGNGLQQKPHSALSAPKAQEVAFSTLCATTINGVCMFAEVEFVFDLEFQQLLGDSAESTAVAIVNMTEGFYESDLGIGFDEITMQFPSTNVFSTSTDARTLLDDLSDRKSAGGLSFIKNPQALTHLVTGRTFSGATAGIAFTDVLCDSLGNGVGTSKLLSSAGASQAALTALVVAHEIGHNFGASHDVAGNACGAGFIMEPRVNSSTSSFSSCSVAEIEGAISRVSGPERCFNFPVDVAISASAENVVEVAAGQAFTTQFSVQTNTTFLALPQLRVVGSVPAAQGRFVSATLNGVACAVASAGQAYTCTLPNPGSVASLQVVALGNESTAAYSHVASVGGSTDLLDTNADNNQLVASFSVTPALPGGSDSTLDTGGDNASIPTSEPPSATTTAPPKSEGGGGGGSFADVALLLFLVALLGRGWNRKRFLFRIIALPLTKTSTTYPKLDQQR
ncbi:MAG: M12 family metallo-peptidase [Pseudomonadales bacterium]